MDTEFQVHVVVDGHRSAVFLLSDGLEPADLVRAGTRAAAGYADLQTYSAPATQALERACAHFLNWLDQARPATPAGCIGEIFYALSLSPLRDRLFTAQRRLRVDLQSQGEGPACRLWDDIDWQRSPALPAAERSVIITASEVNPATGDGGRA